MVGRWSTLVEGLVGRASVIRSGSAGKMLSGVLLVERSRVAMSGGGTDCKCTVSYHLVLRESSTTSIWQFSGPKRSANGASDVRELWR